MALLHVTPRELEHLATSWEDRGLDLAAAGHLLAGLEVGGLEPAARPQAAAVLATWSRLVADLAAGHGARARAVAAVARDHVEGDDLVARALDRLAGAVR